MRKGFFLRFALDSLRKNRRYYLPYALTCTLMQGMLYIITALSRHSGLEQMRGGSTLGEFLLLGTWVIVIFAVIFLFYTHSFLMKQRKSEFGLYHVLGMEKRHIIRIVGTETLVLGAGTTVAGLLFGILLNKAVLLGLIRLLGGEIPLGFTVSLRSTAFTALVFAAIHLGLFLRSAVQILRSSAVSLLQSGQVGEREPKARLIPALAGAGALSWGYAISILHSDPRDALILFFLAVILVIVGTYLLFMAGSITWLKLMKRNRRYYYQTRHFINISGMLYRMKQNAAGLASICILSTMVLVMISGTTSLFLGVWDRVELMYPRQIKLEILAGGPDMASTAIQPQSVLDELAQLGYPPERSLSHTLLKFGAAEGPEGYVPEDNERGVQLMLSSLDDYNALTDTPLTLESDQVLLCGDGTQTQITILGHTYRVAGHVEDRAAQTIFLNQSINPLLGVVLPSRQALFDLYDSYRSWTAAQGVQEKFLVTTLYFDSAATLGVTPLEMEEVIIGRLMEQWIQPFEHAGVIVNLRESDGADYAAIFTGLLFTGIFLSLLFVIATILIIYYKQISEGLQDARRFEIMQKVGLSQLEIRRSIRSQVMTVFFLPLATAGLHCVFAFPIISRMLTILSMDNTSGFIQCMLLSFLAFAALYVLVYSITARTYYRIVSGSESQ